MPLERSQHIKKVATRMAYSTNYTLSGSPIRGGRTIILGGETDFYPCGHERAQGIDSCSCGM
jgi:hypothetical protein